MSESSCLTLNIITPTLKKEAKLPVCVWIHGGAFELSSSNEPLYATSWGHPMVAKDDIVFVSINYRLGIFGYCKFDNGDYNCGLSDQICALEFIRDEIRNFGGDPLNICVFGESAGAMSIGALIASPKANKLFHRAILQSGAAFNALDKEDALHLAKGVAKAYGIYNKDMLSVKDVEWASSASLLSVQTRIQGRYGPLPWQPTIDGENGLLPKHPQEAIANGSAKHLDIMIGYNKDEIHLFRSLVPFGIGPFNQYTVVKGLTPIFGPTMLHFAPDFKSSHEIAEKVALSYYKTHVLDTMTKVSVMNGKEKNGDMIGVGVGIGIGNNNNMKQDIIKTNNNDNNSSSNSNSNNNYYNSSNNNNNNKLSWADVFYKIASHLIFDIPATILVEDHLKDKEYGRRTYEYIFEYDNGPKGACHGCELPFVHGTWIARYQDKRMGELLGYSDDYVNDVRNLSNIMMGSWISFIKTGNPNNKELSLYWPEFTLNKREAMVFGTKTCYIRQQESEEWAHRDGDESFHALVEHRIKAKKSFGFLRLW